jgi:endonuclease YncB( thermonuclease family)
MTQITEHLTLNTSSFVMAPRAAISNFVITGVILFFMFIIGLLLKGRMRLPSELKADETAKVAVPASVPRAIPVGQKIAEPRAYKTGEFWVLPHAQIVVSRSNDADTLRIRSGPKEDVFVLYGVDALQALWTHPLRIAAQANYFGGVAQTRVLDTGGQALAWITELLSKHPFIVYTKYARVPQTERYYAFVRVELEPGKQKDLGELLVRKGFAAPNGPAPDSLPEAGRTPADYHHQLQKALSQAKAEQVGAWAQ